MTRYTVACCASIVAEIEVIGDHVTIQPPKGEDLYRVKPPPRIEDPNLTAEQMVFEHEARDKIHSLVMKRTADHHVSEVIWPDHSSFVIRCGDCGGQLEVGPATLPRLIDLLAAGDWSVTAGVTPLGVLSTKL
jgi:hypothetical protein